MATRRSNTCFSASAILGPLGLLFGIASSAHADTATSAAKTTRTPATATATTGPHLRNKPHNPRLARFTRTVAKQAAQFPAGFYLQALKPGRAVALTFDDGPDPKMTPRLLGILAKHKVKATFFLVGQRAALYPALVKAIHEAGHAIGGHGYQHVNLAKRSVTAAWWHVLTTQKVFESIIGVRPLFYRPPYGAVTNPQVAYFAKRGVKTINWSVDSYDWDRKRNAVDRIIATVLQHAHDGAIILLHSGSWRANTAKALPTIIDKLRARGHTFETIPQLLGIAAHAR